MVSLIVAPNLPLLPPKLARVLNFPAISLPPSLSCRRRRKKRQAVVVVSFGFWDLKRGEGLSWCCWCKGWESEGDMGLEADILEFMEKSEKPEAFPTKKELVRGGRMDLVEAIAKRGGWLSMGWDLESEVEEQEDNVQEIEINTSRDCQENGIVGSDENGVLRDFQHRVDSFQDSNSLEIVGEVGRNGFSSVPANSSLSPSSSGISFEMENEEETGIGGILTRLEKQRNLSFGIDLGKNGCSPGALNKYSGEELTIETPEDADSADHGSSSRVISRSPNNSILNNSGGTLRHSRSVPDFDGSKSSLKPEMWQTWSIQRAGFSEAEFEAAEISFNDDQMHQGKGASKDELLALTEGPTEALDKQKDISYNDIRTRLQHLELELTSALHSLRSKNEEYVPKTGHETSIDLRNASDALEFQENEIMNAQGRLRSIRAKLAVLEGKMALAIIDAQKIVEEKQKRIDGAHRAVRLLHDIHIVWPNSASEVLLAGSYDGWTTQKKMEKTGTGIFSVPLKLYPGRYEIKFIVDGKWRTDPLRPIVHNNGHENNLLIIT